MEKKHFDDSFDNLGGTGMAGSDRDSVDDLATSIKLNVDVESLKRGTLFAKRYEILSEGIKGGMGVVYKCKDIKLDRIKALKVIHPRLLNSEQVVQRFRQEVSISQELLHRNIVRVYDLDEYQGVEFFTMEWVEGRRLRDIITERKKERRPFTLEEANETISQLADILDYAHKHTVHRDIKPENILITEDEEGIQIRLTDFGIAKMLTPSQFTSASSQMGTPYYMAPEQKVDAAHVDKRADIYAVGVVLFELLTLENTIGLEMPSEINKHLPKEIDQVIKKALSTKPEGRYGNIKELADALSNVVPIWKKRIEEERKEAEELRKREEDRSRREAEEADRKRQEEERKKKEEERRRAEEEQKKRDAEKEERRRKEEERKHREKVKFISIISGILIIVIFLAYAFLKPKPESSPPVEFPPPSPAVPAPAKPKEAKPVESPKEPTPAPVGPAIEGPKTSTLITAAEIRDFLETLLRATERGDINDVLGHYSERVDYYAAGVVGKDFIKKDKERFYKRWAKMTYTIIGEVKTVNTSYDDEKIAQFTYDFCVQSENKSIRGRANNSVRVKKIDNVLKIIGEKQEVVKRESG